MHLLAADYPELAAESVAMLKIALGIYVAILFGVSIVASRKVKTESDYLIAGRSLPLVLAWGTLMATWFGAATMFAAAEASRDEGLRGVILDPFACAGTLIFAGLFFARPLWKMKLFTIADFYKQKYGPRAEILGSSIQVPSYFAWIALQYTALSRILATYFDIPLEQGILIAAGVTMVYTMIGGMWSVTLTDSLQILIALVGLLVLAAAVFRQPELGDGSITTGLSSMVEKLNDKHPGHLSFFPGADAVLIMGWIGAWATGLFGCIPGQDLQQRVFASKDENVAVKACILAGVLYMAFGIIPVTLGMASLVTHPPDDAEQRAISNQYEELKKSDTNSPELEELNRQLAQLEKKRREFDPVASLAGRYLTPLWLVVFMVAVVSMVVSTATSAVLAPATLLGHNLLGRVKLFENRKLLRDRLCVVVVTFGGISLSMMGERMMGLLDISLSIALVSLFIPVAFGIYGKPRSQWAALLAMSFGFVTWLVPFLIENVFWEKPEAFKAAYHLYAAKEIAPWMGSVMMVPAKFYGFGFSLLGYFIGQRMGGGVPENSDSSADGDSN
ncbi:MAG: sodium:solute symporter family protein [Planctomycetes bacterium]|nr:sodium:solute symporter family protein [Planctomycetota bacterium]